MLVPVLYPWAMKPERRAVILLLGLAVGGQGLRMWVTTPGTAPGQASLLPPPKGSTPQAHRDSGLALVKPLGPGETVDLDRAPAIEIARLPKVGLKLAKVIVADRNAKGAFGGLEALDRVPGIGPGLLAAIGDKARFSATRPPAPSPGSPSVPSSTGNEERGTRNVFPVVKLNSATAAELETLPKVGPALAARIVAFREKHGPFPTVDSLVRVPGIGPATLELLRSRVKVD
jgi:competence protein ComEA